MGAYRSKPITDKVSSDESGKYVKCGASSMQGWRVTQEDSHNCIIEFDENTSLFAVYDGHGGHEVAQYCSENLPQYLKECISYKSGEYTKALKEAFLGFDATLVDPKVVKVLNNIVKSADEEVEESENQNSGSEDEENIRNLYEEAQMPLEEVMAKYQTDGLNPALKKLKGGTPPSPYLVAKQSSKTKTKFAEEAGSSKAGSSSSSSSTSSGGVEPVEESSSESAEKEEVDLKQSKSEGKEKVLDPSEDSNGEKAPAVDSSKETNGDESSEKDPISSSGSSKEKSEDTCNEKTPQKSKDNNEENASKEVKSESGKEEEKGLNDEPKVEKKQTDNHLKKEQESGKQETKEGEKEKKSPIKKLEVNGDVEPKDLKKDTENEPHENGDVAEEETEDDDENEKETTKSRKGKGKAIIKMSEKPKRTSARQRNMAILFRSFLAAQDSADSESDDEGDESFQGAEERSSSEDEDKEEAEAEGEDEDEEEEGVEVEDGEEEEEDEEEEEEEEEFEEEDLPKIAKGPGVESGCTAVVALLHGRDLYVANAGDSRCIVSRGGEALDMSLDHKPEDDIEIERIVAAGGFVSCDGRVNGGLNLSRAIGDHAYKQTENLPPEEQMITALPDVRTLSIDTEKDEFMVLACDGIWNSMTSQEVVNFVRTRLQSGEEKLLSQICEELFDFCLAPDTASDGTGCDNMTAVIVQFLPILSEAKSSDLPNTSISTATNKRPASPTENTDSSAKRLKTGVV
ncbi:hypothetical protein R5R35_012254 [Gryllus longicercus]|uniref:protein-serine/threonine phosphatase n=1 Tax=Gryllus longicercus TaxID=2509291 RepID=A0AAN9VH27_9ORTH